MRPTATLMQPPVGSSSSRNRISPQAAAEKLHALVESRPDSDACGAIEQVVEIAAELTGALGVVFLQRDADQQLVIKPTHYSPSNLSHLRSLMQHIMRLSSVAAAEGTPQAGTTKSDANLIVAAVPVLGGSAGNEALAMAMSVASPDQARATTAYLIQMLTWIAAVVVCFRKTPDANGDHHENASFRELQAMCLQAARQQNPAARNRLVADWVQRTTQCDDVLVGWRRRSGGRCRLIGHAGYERFDTRSDRISAAEEFFDEVLIASDHDVSDPGMLNTKSSALLEQLTGKRISQRPVLRSPNGDALGVVLCLSEDDTASRPLAAEVVSVLGHQMHWMITSQPTWWARVIQSGRSTQAWHRQPVFWAAVIGMILLMLIPTPLKIKTPCVVQPQQRRFVSVPYDGRLENALTKPGDMVLAGQLLAKMDSRDVQWEISTLTADLRRAEKSRDAALADSETSSAQIAGFEAERLRLQIRELRERLENLEVRSPVNGVVVSGDPEKLEGATFSMGDTLLEVAPLTDMLVELEIADEDVSHVRVGQRVTFRLAASPLNIFAGEIRTIQPRSELRDNRNVFVGHVELKNADDRLRPGMRGHAKIVGDVHLLGWNLFHKAWNRVASWIIW